MRVALTIKEYRAKFVLQRANRLPDRRAFAKAQESWDVGKFPGPRGMRDFNDAPGFAVINHGGGKDGLFVGGKRAIGTGDKAWQRIERRNNHSFTQTPLHGLPFCHQRRPARIGFAAQGHRKIWRSAWHAHRNLEW
jgi:hypothetical protein